MFRLMLAKHHEAVGVHVPVHVPVHILSNACMNVLREAGHGSCGGLIHNNICNTFDALRPQE